MYSAGEGERAWSSRGRRVAVVGTGAVHPGVGFRCEQVSWCASISKPPNHPRPLGSEGKGR